MTEGNTSPPTIIWTRGFCALPSPLCPHWMMASCLSPSPLGWRKMVFVLPPAKMPVAWARRDMGWVRAWVAPRVCPFVQQEQSLLPQHCGSVAGWMAAFWLSCLEFVAIPWFEITTHSNKSRWICNEDKGRPEMMPCGISSLILCQMSHWLCKKEVLEHIYVMAFKTQKLPSCVSVCF